jgi:predicted site-specific integrase-resolvase
MHYSNQNYLTGEQAAALLGVSRRTIHRWIDEGRIAYPLTRADLEARMPHKRQRGPKRNPKSKRYTLGRHKYEQSIESRTL